MIIEIKPNNQGRFLISLNGENIGCAKDYIAADVFAYHLERQETGNPVKPMDRESI